MSFEHTKRSSSWRSRFSSSTFSEYGRPDTPEYPARSSAERLKISTDSPASLAVVRVPNEFVLMIVNPIKRLMIEVNTSPRRTQRKEKEDFVFQKKFLC